MTATQHNIIFGDSRQMPELEDQSVHLAVTSPPYWNIKDYGGENQIGYGSGYQEYLSDMQQVIEEIHRCLHPGCRAAINIGDQYLRASDFGRYRVKPIPADLIQIGQKAGFDFMGNIIWKKISTTQTSGGGSWMGSGYYPKDGHVTYEHEYILLFRKQGDWPRPTPEQKEKSKLAKKERSKWFRGVWEVPPVRQEGHVAMFPTEIPRRLIKMYSFHGEVVLDPFMGSGTTARAATLEGRDSIGFELDKECKALMKEKISRPNRDLFHQPELTFKTR